MTQNNNLSKAPPFAVVSSLKELGENLKTARIRRRITIEEAAERIGVGIRAVRDAERGKATTAIAVYIALLWLYGLSHQLRDIANPALDQEGLRLSSVGDPKRATKLKRGIDNDF
jgi:transcriptional regulator with XRE-family HTH domain